MNTARRIKKLRVEKLELTQREFASRLNLDPITISRWERGVTKPSDLHRVLLARQAGGHPNDFLDDEEAAA
jgi:DNA-binding transcriptional regulator YiaG